MIVLGIEVGQANFTSSSVSFTFLLLNNSKDLKCHCMLVTRIKHLRILLRIVTNGLTTLCKLPFGTVLLAYNRNNLNKKANYS